jgi:hypothetical protein
MLAFHLHLQRNLTDALNVLDRFAPQKQKVIKEWYPKIEAAQKAVRLAHAEMAMVLTEPPISLWDEYFTGRLETRKAIVDQYERTWNEYERLGKEFEKAAAEAVAEVVDIALPHPLQLPPLQLPPLPRLPRLPRRSKRLVAKPRVNYEEQELEEEIEAREAAKEAKRQAREAAKEAKRQAREAAKETKRQAKEAEHLVREAEERQSNLKNIAEYKKQIEAKKQRLEEIKRPHLTIIQEYADSCKRFNEQKVWQRPDSEEMAAHRAIKAKYMEAQAHEIVILQGLITRLENRISDF